MQSSDEGHLQLESPHLHIKIIEMCGKDEIAVFQSRSATSLPRHPAGTGKTSTIASLLSVVACSGYRSIVCPPTNVAIAEVALRFLRFFDPEGPLIFNDDSFKLGGGVDHHTSKIRLGDVVITRNGERMKIGGSSLEKIYIGRPIPGSSNPRGSMHVGIIDRGARIKVAMMPETGWAGTAHEVVNFVGSRQ